MGKKFQVAVNIVAFFLVWNLAASSLFAADPTPTPTFTPTPTPTSTPIPTPTLVPTPTPTPEPGSTSTPEPSPTPTLDEETAQRLLEIQKEESDITQTLVQLKQEKKTLSSQIAIFDNQIKLITLQIEQTQKELDRLEEEIKQLTQTLGKLKVDLAKVEQVLTERIRATYKKGNLSVIELLVSSSSFSDFFNRFKYLQIIQAADRRSLYQTQQTKAVYTSQKEDAEKKEQEEAALKTKLDSQNQSLKQQKADKDRLLDVTNNDERKFQARLAELEADAASIAKALGNIGVKLGDRNRGDPIAFVGSTGCSTGPHLHFEVYREAKVENGYVADINSGDPIQFKLSSHLVNPHQYLDNGTFQKPVPDYPNNITTEFGENSIFGTPHTGLDMAEPLGTTIVAAEAGIAYQASAPCSIGGKVVQGGTAIGKGVVIDHRNGMVTLYWHVL